MLNNELNFVFIKDPHIMIGFNFPANRFQSFHSEIENKWNYILDYMEKNNIDNLFCTGDLFDKMNISQWDMKIFFKNEEFLLNLKKRLNGKAIYSIRGNHDEFNGQNTNENTVFGTFVKLGLINYFGDTDNTKNFVEFNINNKIVKIFGFDYVNNDTILYDKLKNYNFDADYNICVTHSAVVDVTTGKENFGCVGYDYLINNNNKVDMWVLGHYHKGYDTKYYKNKYFINSWNLTRLARDEYVLNNEHTPEFVHVKINVDNKISISSKNIKIPCIGFKEAFKSDVTTIAEILVDEFKFFTKLDEEVSENFDEFLKLEEMKKDGKITKEVFDIIKEHLN